AGVNAEAAGAGSAAAAGVSSGNAAVAGACQRIDKQLNIAANSQAASQGLSRLRRQETAAWWRE
ncbi:hypothetical protein, partial [Achromobacter animicus]|uniref:hypothetical protein n=1 Tax=Achromobacter animicus TaxID=1389935 RepID=UPI0028A78205